MAASKIYYSRRCIQGGLIFANWQKEEMWGEASKHGCNNVFTAVAMARIPKIILLMYFCWSECHCQAAKFRTPNIDKNKRTNKCGRIVVRFAICVPLNLYSTNSTTFNHDCRDTTYNLFLCLYLVKCELDMCFSFVVFGYDCGLNTEYTCRYSFSSLTSRLNRRPSESIVALRPYWVRMSMNILKIPFSVGFCIWTVRQKHWENSSPPSNHMYVCHFEQLALAIQANMSHFQFHFSIALHDLKSIDSSIKTLSRWDPIFIFQMRWGEPNFVQFKQALWFRPFFFIYFLLVPSCAVIVTLRCCICVGCRWLWDP